jgi:antirestriction protein ArdC
MGRAMMYGHWLKALQDDKRLIFTAAAHEQRAVDYLHSLPPVQQTDQQSKLIEEEPAAA